MRFTIISRYSGFNDLSITTQSVESAKTLRFYARDIYRLFYEVMGPRQEKGKTMLVKDLIEKLNDLNERNDERGPSTSFYWKSGYETAINDVICLLYDVQDEQLREEFTAKDIVEIIGSKETFTIEIDAEEVLKEILLK